MKMVRTWLSILVAIFFLAGCGYHNPNVYNGPDKVLYMVQWKNRSSQLGLDSKIYRSLTKWFQKSGNIHTVREKEGADLILAGEIVSLALPSLAYGTQGVATEVMVRLRIRYILKEIATGKIVMEVPDKVWTENYIVSSSSAVNKKRELEALDNIIEEVAQRIYQRTVSQLPKM